MNFFAGRIENGHVHLPFGSVPVPAGLTGGRDVIVGARPEDFEDAALAPQGQGLTFDAPIEIIESMGSELYAYFTFQGGEVRSAELEELAQDSGISETPSAAGGGDGQQAVARLSADSDARIGRTARLWLDTDKLHFFNPQDGRNVRDFAAAGASGTPGSTRTAGGTATSGGDGGAVSMG
jgi:multiple sugar transport system ATP-binding protein